MHTIPKISAAQLAKCLQKNILILDARAIVPFSESHIPGAINVGLRPNFIHWVGMLVPSGQPLYLVLDDESQAADVVAELAGVGYDQVQGYLEGGMAAWKEEGLPTEKIPLIAPEEVVLMMEVSDPETFVIVDVRNSDEWEAAHMDQAHHIPIHLLTEKLEFLSKEKLIIVTCASGYRASIAASLLKRHNFPHVLNLAGGMQAWNGQR